MSLILNSLPKIFWNEKEMERKLNFSQISDKQEWTTFSTLNHANLTSSKGNWLILSQKSFSLKSTSTEHGEWNTCRMFMLPNITLS